MEFGRIIKKATLDDGKCTFIHQSGTYVIKDPTYTGDRCVIECFNDVRKVTWRNKDYVFDSNSQFVPTCDESLADGMKVGLISLSIHVEIPDSDDKIIYTFETDDSPIAPGF